MGGFDLVDGQDVAAIVSEFKAHEQDAKDQAAQAAADAARAAQEKQQALASMLITSGFNFDGFTITRYSGYISGDDAVSVERPTHSWAGVKGNVGDDLLEALVRIRRNALVELKEAAYALGCNAVIGVDIDYLTLDPEINMKGSAGTATVYLPFLFGVTANGNAVVIEKTG
jgi:uncharacterized protein YbjQ (UPF0145 family)